MRDGVDLAFEMNLQGLLGPGLPRSNQRVGENSSMEFTKNSPKDSTKG